MRKISSGVTVIEKFAQFIAGISSEQISQSGRESAALAILDVIGVAVAGAPEPAPVASAAWAATAFAPGSATLWFSGQTTSVLGATFANAAAASAMDGDDTHWPSWMHSGSAIVPAVLAAAEELGSEWNDVLDAIVIGYEVTCRIAGSVDWAAMKQIATGHWCVFGTAAAVGRLRGSTAPELARALAVCMGLRPYVYVPDDELNLNGIKEGVSWGSYTGIASLELSKCGLDGPMHGLDHELFDRVRLLKEHNGTWAIEEVSIKPYATCAWPHAPIEALVTIMSRDNITASEIQAITVTTFPQAVTYINNEADPQTLEAAQYNIPFNVAVAAIDGEQAFFPLKSSTLHRAELIDLANRVELIGDEAFGRALPAKHPVRVAIKTENGTYEHSLDSETNPHDLATVTQKFRSMSTPGLSAQQQDKIVETVWGRKGTVADLTAILRAPLEQSSKS